MRQDSRGGSVERFEGVQMVRTGGLAFTDQSFRALCGEVRYELGGTILVWHQKGLSFSDNTTVVAYRNNRERLGTL